MSAIARIQSFLGADQWDITLILAMRAFRALFLRSYAPGTSFAHRMSMDVPIPVHVVWMAVHKMQTLARSLSRPAWSDQALRQLIRAERRDVGIRRVTLEASAQVQHRLLKLGQVPWEQSSELSAWRAWQHRNTNTQLMGKAAPAQPTTSASVRHLQGNLPLVCWNHILDYLVATPSSAACLIDVSRGHRSLVRHHPMNKVFLHAYLQAAPVESNLVQLSSTYQLYATEVVHGKRIGLGNHELHRLYEYIKVHAAAWLHTPIMTPEVVGRIQQLDYDMLYLHAFDCLSLNDPTLHALPVSLFWRASKYQPHVRNMFMNPNHQTPGVLRQTTLNLYRSQLMHHRNSLLNELNSVQYLMLGRLVKNTVNLFSPRVIAMKPFNTHISELLMPNSFLAPIADKLVFMAECNVERYDAIRAVVPTVARGLATHLYSRCRQLQHNTFHRVHWMRWWSFLMQKATPRGCEVRLRICRDRDPNEVIHLLFTHVTILPCIRTWMLVAKRQVGPWPQAHLSPRILSAPDVVATWSNGVGWAWVNDDSAATYDWMNRTETTLIETFTAHGRITGVCAACGRSLRRPNEWIGRTCKMKLRIK